MFHIKTESCNVPLSPSTPHSITSSSWHRLPACVSSLGTISHYQSRIPSCSPYVLMFHIKTESCRRFQSLSPRVPASPRTRTRSYVLMFHIKTESCNVPLSPSTPHSITSSPWHRLPACVSSLGTISHYQSRIPSCSPYVLMFHIKTESCRRFQSLSPPRSRNPTYSYSIPTSKTTSPFWINRVNIATIRFNSFFPI